MKQQPALEAFWSTYLHSLPEQDRNTTYLRSVLLRQYPTSSRQNPRIRPARKKNSDVYVALGARATRQNPLERGR